jgi:predicted Fe-Mo cluster-binding NifX family protein
LKLAVITDDGKTISQHFGRALYYMVLEAEDNKIVSREQRDKVGHHTFAGHEQEHLAPGEKHGFDAGAQSRHASMMSNIMDCQVLIAGGMGWGAYEGLKSAGIQGIVTDVEDIEEAVKLFLEGKLANLMDRLH